MTLDLFIYRGLGQQLEHERRCGLLDGMNVSRVEPDGGVPAYEAGLAALIGGSSVSQVLDGTSMATPHIVGLALYLAAAEGISSVSKLSDRIKELGPYFPQRMQCRAEALYASLALMSISRRARRASRTPSLRSTIISNVLRHSSSPSKS